MQKYVNLVDLVNGFLRSICLQKSASIQPRASLFKFRSDSTHSFSYSPPPPPSQVIRRSHNLRIFGIPDPLVEAMIDVARDREVKAGEVLFRQGEPGSEFFVLAAGRLEVTKDTIE